MKVCRVSEIRELDKTAIEEYAIPAEILMENAGGAVSSLILNEIGVEGKTFLVFCGMGNNGGDGLVVARKLHSNGGHIKVFLTSAPQKYTGAAKTNFDILSRLPIEIVQLFSTATLKTELAHSDAIVDALLGTGITRPVGGLYRDVVEAINQSGKPVSVSTSPLALTAIPEKSWEPPCEQSTLSPLVFPKLAISFTPAMSYAGSST